MDFKNLVSSDQRTAKELSRTSFLCIAYLYLMNRKRQTKHVQHMTLQYILQGDMCIHI